ncbi:MAG: Lrp/AsnC family transcriptional regulator [Candidatus Micrarchaeota archaeon]
MKLDARDRKLLDLLYVNSRASFTQLGKKLRLSSAAVERRLSKLKKEGIVSLLFADVNLAKLGLKAYRLYLKFDVMDKKTEREVVRLFEEYPRTLWGVICEGEYDVLLRFVARNEFEVEKVIAMLLQKFGKKIIDKTLITTTYQTYFSWNKAFETPRKPELPVERMEKEEEVDRIDVEILSALYANARESTVGISKKVGLTPDAVNYRIRKLTAKRFILGYTAWYDAKKLGFNYYKLLLGFRNVTADMEKEFIQYCVEKDDVVFLNKTIGSWDLEVDIIVKDNKELHEFVREMKTKFGNIIGKHHFIAAIEERMLNPLRGE